MTGNEAMCCRCNGGVRGGLKVVVVMIWAGIIWAGAVTKLAKKKCKNPG